MSSAPAPDGPGPEAHQLGFGRAFLLSFGICALPPLLLYAVTEATNTSSAFAGAFVLLPVVLGLGMIVAGVVQMVRGRTGGGGLILGALAGFVVGFSLCVGTFTLDLK